MITDKQVLKLRAQLSKNTPKGVAALKAGMDRGTARKYARSPELPSQRPPLVRTYKTRANPFEEAWPGLEAMLRAAPELESKTLFEHLQEQSPGKYEPGQLRTLQRHIERWRAGYGPDLEVFFAQDHRPGEAGQTDFTWGNELGITIGGVPLEHMLCHFVLPYSNWDWATVAFSESMLALRRGVQSALLQLGRRPTWHQTDNSAAATHDLATGKRGFNDEYLAMMRHFGMKPRTIGVGESEQNGDIEAANGVLKRRLEQMLLLRGSRDFTSVDIYETWVQSQCRRANAPRQTKVAAELAVMGEINPAKLCEHADINARVTAWSTVYVKENIYSVPSRLIGQDVRIRISEREIEIWFAGRCEVRTERLIGRSGHRIDYRHVIWSLVRKPGAFARYRFREDLFPTVTFRRAYDALLKNAATEVKADVEYLRLLFLAASTLQVDVEAGIELLMGQGELPTAEQVKVLQGKDKMVAAPDIPVFAPDLSEYDALLGRDTPELEYGT